MHRRKAPSTAAVYTRAALLGFVAGMRSQMPLFLLAVAARRATVVRGTERLPGLLRSRRALRARGALVVIELVYDKVPVVPSRLHPLSLALRLTTGSLAGAAITHEAGASAPVSGEVGAAAAIAGAVAGYHFRASLTRWVRSPAVAAVVEDVAALGLGSLAVSRRRFS